MKVWLPMAQSQLKSTPLVSPHLSLRCSLASTTGRARENGQGNNFGVDKGSGEEGLSSEMSVNTKEDKAFEKDVLNPSLIRQRRQEV